MPSKSSSGTTEMPPTAMSRSLSLGSPPATNAWASTTERVPGRVARSARMRRMASPRTARCERVGSSHAAVSTSGSR